MKPTSTDPRILSLAAEVAKSPEQNVPVILLKLKEIINSTPLGSAELKKIKRDIYCYDLIRYCLLVLSQDCSRIQGGWTTISQLTQILSHCCVGLEPGEDGEEFYKELLPSAAENFLVLGRRLQTCFINAAKACVYLVLYSPMIFILSNLFLVIFIIQVFLRCIVLS